MSDVAERVRALLNPILESMGLSLWDVEFRLQGPKWLLRIYIDRETGVTLDDCEAVSRDLGAVLDVEEVIRHAYTLEVSSPGLDRTLSKPEHFVRFAGRAVRIKTYEPINGQKVFRGRLLSTAGSAVTIEVEGGPVIDILLDQIAKASLEVEF